VAPSYVVPVASAAVMAVAPLELMLITSPFGSNAKLFGAVIVLPEVVQVDESSSAMKASLNGLPTYYGNSAERKRKSNERQLIPLDTERSIFRIETS